MQEDEKAELVERLVRRYGDGARDFAQAYARVHGNKGRICARDAWLQVAAAIDTLRTEAMKEGLI